MESKIIRGCFTKDLNWILKDKNYEERASVFLGKENKERYKARKYLYTAVGKHTL